MISRILFFSLVLLTFCNPASSTKENLNSSEKNVVDDKEVISNNWKIEVKSISNDDLTDVSFVGDLNVWVTDLKGQVIGDYDSYRIERSGIIRTIDGGNSWKRINLNVPETSFVRKIYFINQLRGWLITQGDRTNPDKTPFWLLETVDGGDSWKVIYTFVARNISKIIFTEEGEGWIVGSIKSNNSLINGMALYINNFGNTWINVYSDKFSTIKSGGIGAKDVSSPIEDIRLTSYGEAVLVFQNGTIFKLSSNKEKWEQGIIKETKEFGSNHLIFRGNDEYLLLSPKVPGNGNVALHTLLIKGGSILEKGTQEDFYLKDVISISENELLACGHISIFNTPSESNNQISQLSQSPVVFYSKDNGKTWEKIYETLGFVQYVYNQDEKKDPLIKMEYGKHFQGYQGKTIQSISFNKITTNGNGKYFIVGDNGFLVKLEKFQSTN